LLGGGSRLVRNQGGYGAKSPTGCEWLDCVDHVWLSSAAPAEGSDRDSGPRREQLFGVRGSVFPRGSFGPPTLAMAASAIRVAQTVMKELRTARLTHQPD
jgi:hypothetical protein